MDEETLDNKKQVVSYHHTYPRERQAYKHYLATHGYREVAKSLLSLLLHYGSLGAIEIVAARRFGTIPNGLAVAALHQASNLGFVTSFETGLFSIVLFVKNPSTLFENIEELEEGGKKAVRDATLHQTMAYIVYTSGGLMLIYRFGLVPLMRGISQPEEAVQIFEGFCLLYYPTIPTRLLLIASQQWVIGTSNNTWKDKVFVTGTSMMTLALFTVLSDQLQTHVSTEKSIAYAYAFSQLSGTVIYGLRMVLGKRHWFSNVFHFNRHYNHVVFINGFVKNSLINAVTVLTEFIQNFAITLVVGALLNEEGLEEYALSSSLGLIFFMYSFSQYSSILKNDSAIRDDQSLSDYNKALLAYKNLVSHLLIGTAFALPLIIVVVTRTDDYQSIFLSKENQPTHLNSDKTRQLLLFTGIAFYFAVNRGALIAFAQSCKNDVKIPRLIINIATLFLGLGFGSFLLSQLKRPEGALIGFLGNTLISSFIIWCRCLKLNFGAYLPKSNGLGPIGFWRQGFDTEYQRIQATALTEQSAGESRRETPVTNQVIPSLWCRMSRFFSVSTANYVLQPVLNWVLQHDTARKIVFNH